MTSLEQQIQQFITYLDTERDVSPHTLTAYRSDLAQFLLFALREKGETVAAQDIEHLFLRRYLAGLSKNTRKSSIGRKLAAIRSFFRFLLRRGSIGRNPAELIATPKKEQKLRFIWISIRPPS